MENSNDLVKVGSNDLTSNMVEPGEILRIIDHVHVVLRDAMKEGINDDYGIIPGTVKKSLLKPGAEKLLMAFGLTAIPRPPQIVDMPRGHREVTVETEIRSIKSGRIHAVGLGSCSTMEGKYRYRKADVVCPECKQATIIKGKAEFGGGWLCYKKKGGCGKTWKDENNPFDGVITDKVEHDNPADQYNTVLKMASKRSMVDGTIRATASSAMFTQDDEDLPGAEEALEKKKNKVGDSVKEKTPPAGDKTKGKSTGDKAADASKENVREALKAEISAYCKGDKAAVEKLLAELSHYEKDGKIHEMKKFEQIDDPKVFEWKITNILKILRAKVKSDLPIPEEEKANSGIPQIEGCTQNPESCEHSVLVDDAILCHAVGDKPCFFYTEKLPFE